MRPILTAFTLGLAAICTTPAAAALAVGAPAPDFTTRGAQGGAISELHLADLLKQGPVVIYFFPAAFTGGCTAESHDFADNIDKFRAAGVTVIGMSADPVDTLARFSKEECANKFPMASAGKSIVDGYDVDAGGVTSRTTYVIAPTGRIGFVYDDEDYYGHVGKTLAFVQSMKK